MTVIAEHGGWPYRDRMTAFLRMLAILALVMMPFGMAAAPAAAALDPHQAMSGMEPGHCDDMGERDEDKAPPASHCALACSAITAAPAPTPEPLKTSGALPALPATQTFIGRQPEADPPPPKLA